MREEVVDLVRVFRLFTGEWCCAGHPGPTPPAHVVEPMLFLVRLECWGRRCLGVMNRKQDNHVAVWREADAGSRDAVIE